MAEFKLKGLNSLDLEEGEKREVEVEGLESKVLLVKVGGKTTALGSKCTHYGAPLVNGVLTGHRLKCQWHGACFNVTSGDVEDAPALDALPTFKLSEKDGAVYISGEKETIKGSRRKPNIKCKAAGQEKVVIVGGGSAAIGALEALREKGFKGSITVISSEGYLPIDRTKLSKALIADPSKIALRDEEWFKSADVAFTTNEEVNDVDFSAKKVSTKNGNSYPYTKLILATGGTPKNLPLPGFKELGNIFLLRTIPHVKDILAAIGDKGKKIVVIGSSFIGMEVANAVAKDNTVSVVGMEKVPLERVMGEEVGKIFQTALEKNGVKFYMNAGVEKASPSKKDPSKVASVELKDGTSLEADLVILGVGVGPATTFLKENKGVTLEKDGSLKTDEHFAVKGLKDVYAVGDIATYPYNAAGGKGSPVRIEHWNVAQDSGRHAAAHIVDPSTGPPTHIPYFWSALGAQLRYCGHPTGETDVLLQGEPDKGKWVAFYAQGEEIVAVGSQGADPVVTHAAELLRLGKMPSKSDLKGKKPDFILGIRLPAPSTV